MRGDVAASAGGEGEERGRGTFADNDTSRFEAAQADDGRQREADVDAAAAGVEVEDPFTAKRDFDEGVGELVLLFIEVASQRDFPAERTWRGFVARI